MTFLGHAGCSAPRTPEGRALGSSFVPGPPEPKPAGAFGSPSLCGAPVGTPLQGTAGVRSVHPRPQESSRLGWETRSQVQGHLPPAAPRAGEPLRGKGGCSRAGTDLEAQGLPDRTCGCRGPRPFLSCSSAPWGGPALRKPLTHGSGRSHRASSVLRLTRPTADRPPGHGLHVRSRNQPDLRSRFSSYLTLD